MDTKSWATAAGALVIGVAIGVGGATATSDSTDEVSPNGEELSSDEVDDLRADNLYLKSQLEDLQAEMTEEEPLPAPSSPEPEPEELSEPSVVFEFSGTNETESRDFTVDGTWEFRWETVGGGLSPVLELYKSSNPRFSQDYWDLGPAKSGKTLVRRGGTFFFRMDVYKNGPWKVTVIDLPG